jgi:hypothetical protein
MNPLPKGFVAFPSTPDTCAESLAAAARSINDSGGAILKLWTECAIGGVFIIDEVCEQITNADFLIADITGLNPNVLFELGYAIAKRKRVWLVADDSFSHQKSRFERLGLLTTVGYKAYTNSQQLQVAFYKDSPHISLERTILGTDLGVRVTSQSTAPATVLYFRSRHQNEAALCLDRRIDKIEGSVIEDPHEGTLASLIQFAQRVYRATGVLCHLTSPERNEYYVDNARQALLAGLALGFEKELLILAEGDSLTPLDYRNLSINYKNARAAQDALDEWLEPITELAKDRDRRERQHRIERALHQDLSDLTFGEYIAENEADELVASYFIDTESYRRVSSSRNSIVVGRKGSGKTAILFKINSELVRDRRNVVCVVKPPSYEVNALVALLKAVPQLERRSYALEALWKLLLYGEIAKTLQRNILERELATHTAKETRFLDRMNLRTETLEGTFGERLDRFVNSLVKELPPDAQYADATARISERLHGSVLPQIVGDVLDLMDGRQRVFFLMDNLDKAWERKADVPLYSEILLALFGAIDRVASELRKGQSGKPGVEFSFSIFVRADIFEQVRTHAREKDKLDATMLRWDDHETLIRVLEERFKCSLGIEDSQQLWSRYFCQECNTIPTRQYMTSVIFPRPRDLLLLAAAALNAAIDRGHTKIQTEDIDTARRQYSQFALDSILVENGVRLPKLEELIYECAGEKEILELKHVEALASRIELDVGEAESAIEHLTRLGFFKLEIDTNVWEYCEDLTVYRTTLARARNFAKRMNRPIRLRIHDAFHPALGIIQE